MSKNYRKLSALKVAQISEPGYFGDGDGLYLQVSKAITKSWIFRFNYHGSRHEMGLGPLRDVSLKDARDAAHRCRQVLREGGNPLTERRQAAVQAILCANKGLSFDECAAAFISAHKDTWRNDKHRLQWEATIRTYASPIIGRLPVGEVDTSLVVKVLQQIWSTKTETATRLRGRLERVLDWATVMNFRQGENPARWRGHLDKLLASPEKLAPVKHHPALPWREIPKFYMALRQREGISPRALEFLIATAARSGEVRSASWDEIDLDRRLWVVPAERMKAGREHRVPLSTEGLRIISALETRSGLLFPGAKGDALSDMSLSAVLGRMEYEKITVHGFRSTFRDWASEHPGNTFPREVCEQALAHTISNKVEAAYRRGDLLEKRRELMEAWAKYIIGQ
jgi:integrase